MDPVIEALKSDTLILYILPDELYEEEAEGLADLAGTAEALLEQEHDPDLDVLSDAVARADEVSRIAQTTLDPPKPGKSTPTPSEEGASSNEALPAVADDMLPGSEAEKPSSAEPVEKAP